jgi:hypothetical protein
VRGAREELVTLDLETGTGEPVWRTVRPRRRESFTTPVLYPSPVDPRHLLVYGSQWVDACEVDSGELAWSLGGVSAAPVPSPVFDGDGCVSAEDWRATDDEMTAEGWGVFGIQLRATPKVLWNYQRNTAYIGSW